MFIDDLEYQQLILDSQLLLALRQAGVDNWDGYDYALDLFKEITE